MSLINESNPHLIVVPLGDLAADASVPACYVPFKAKVLSCALVNGAVLAASDTNYAQVSLKDSADLVLAEIDTRAAHENGLAAFVGKAMNVVEAAQILEAGTSLKAVYDETDAGTNVALTDAVMVIELAKI